MGPTRYGARSRGADVSSDSESTAAPGPEAAPGVNDLLRSLITFARVLNIYPEGHERILRHAEHLDELFQAALAGGEPRTISVDSGALFVDGVPFDGTPAIGAQFAELLNLRGVGSVVLKPGLAGGDIRELTELLRVCPKVLVRNGGVREYLKEHPFERVEFVLESGTPGRVRDGSPEGAEGGDDVFRFVVEDRHGPAAPLTRDASDAEPETPPVTEAEPDVVGVEAALEEIRQHDLGAETSERLPRPGSLDREATELPKGTGVVLETFRKRVTHDDLAYGLVGDEIMPEPSREMVPVALKSYREQLETHDTEHAAAAILCDLLASASTRKEYGDRRRLLTRTVAGGRFARRHLRPALVALGRLESLEFEEVGALILELAASSGDEEILKSFVDTRRLKREIARETAMEMTLREDALDMLAFLTRAPLGEGPRQSLIAIFTRAVRSKPVRFQQWALQQRREFLHPETFGLLLESCHYLLGPVVKEILLTGAEAEQQALVRLLAADGTERALRLLTLGMRYAGERRTPELIAAFAEFDHPLAIAVLKEVVHRCNTENFCVAEAETAIVALGQSRSEAAREFLWEICSRRFVGLHSYGRRLRALAEEALGA